MCNPRRVQVTLTQDIALAWEREVSRTVAMSSQVTGTAKLTQSLADSIGSPIRRALEIMLEQGCSGWEELDQGYRYAIDGGYVIYNPDSCTLEIVATLEGKVETKATATSIVSGEIQETLTTTKDGHYYDDGYGGRTKDKAKMEASLAAEIELDKQEYVKLSEAKKQAEKEHAASVLNQAELTARYQLDQLSQQEQEILSQQARENLGVVGIQCRQAFNGLLGMAYRDAILAYARRHGAESITCEDDGNIVEIEFFMEG